MEPHAFNKRLDKVSTRRPEHGDAYIGNPHRPATQPPKPLRNDDLVRDRSREDIPDSRDKPEQIIQPNLSTHAPKTDQGQTHQTGAEDDRLPWAETMDKQWPHPKGQQRR